MSGIRVVIMSHYITDMLATETANNKYLLNEF